MLGVAAVAVAVGLVRPARRRSSSSIDRIYYGTDTRAGELMVGRRRSPPSRRRPAARRRARAWSALGRRRRRRRAGRRRSSRWCDHPDAGAVALRHGLLPLPPPLLAACSSLGALVPLGPVAASPRLRPLRCARPHQLQLVPGPLADHRGANQITATDLALAALGGIGHDAGASPSSARASSSCPVRRRTLPPAPLIAAATVVAVVIVTTLVLPAGRHPADEFLDGLPTRPGVELRPPTAAGPEPDDRSRRPTASRGRRTSAAVARRRALDTTTPSPHVEPAVALFGDSVAFSLALSSPRSRQPFELRARVGGDIGCGTPCPRTRRADPCDTSRRAGRRRRHEIGARS